MVRGRVTLTRLLRGSMALYDRECTACLLHNYARSVCIPADGENLERAMVVGEAPGANEDRYGKPFVGRAGEVLDRALREAFGTDTARQSVVVTNAVKCRPPANRDPSGYETQTCVTRYLSKEIEVFDPVCILTLGNTATEALLEYTGISSLRGTWFPLDSEVERWVMPTWHPAYVGYQGGVGSEAWHQFLADTTEFARRVRDSG